MGELLWEAAACAHLVRVCLRELMRCWLQCTINDVLDFRQLDQGLMMLRPEPVAVGDLVSSTLAHCRSFFLPSIDMDFCVAPPDATIMADRRRLVQVLANCLR